ncbi:hypothetical protein AB0J21_26370 [Streptomyces sp. NPDC049954]|uniref:hypothetical protein n=1 Tax=Streptomyces sp. NPDC049954 TaxID=3155779 RepID=UPI003418DB40
MSLPLTRRIASAALLIAAGAAPVIGAAGTASAADLPLGGLGLDGKAVAKTLDGATKSVAKTGNKTVKEAAPEVKKLVGHAGKSATPATGHTTGDLASSAGSAVSGVTGGKGGLTHGLSNNLSTNDLPLGR